MPKSYRVRFVGGPLHNRHLVVKLRKQLWWRQPSDGEPPRAGSVYACEFHQYLLERCQTGWGTPFFEYNWTLMADHFLGDKLQLIN